MGTKTKGAFGGDQNKKHDFVKDPERLELVCKKCLKVWTKEELWNKRKERDWIIKLPTGKCYGRKKPK